MPRRAVLLVAALAVAGSTLPTGARAALPGGRDVEATGLEWRPCHGDAECAVLPVPLDDTAPGGRAIALSLVRYRALDPSRRIGSLVINNGGPGASAVDYVVAAARSLPRTLQERFDIVGFDPRGVGASQAVDCTDDLDAYYELEWAPDDAAERVALLDGVRDLVDACTAAASGDLLPYLATDRVARDLDRIRAALGDEKLTYLGYSYGTLLGAWYAEQFPDNVRALVLDGVIDPSLTAEELQVQQAEGFERALDLFLRSCARDRRCDFHRDGRSGRAYDRLRRRIGRSPIPTDEPGRSLNGTRFDLAVSQLLYEGRAAWPELATALDDAATGDGSALLFYADLYTGRVDEDSYTDTQEAFVAISCADGPPVGDATAMQAIEERAAEVAPRLGRSIVNGSLPCAFWPFAPPAPRVLDAQGAPPILLLGTRDDPATPFAWARAVARDITSAVLVSVAGSQHTAFPAGDRCVDRQVVRYLVRRAVPADRTRC